jgi:hypothetical protein
LKGPTRLPIPIPTINRLDNSAMKPASAAPRFFQFYFPTLDTLVQVEDRAGEVVVRTSRNTFSEDRKAYFLHELAAEGFIPDCFQWLAPSGWQSGSSVRWLVDVSCFEPAPEALARTRRFMIRLLSSATLLWLLLLGAILIH